MSSDEYAENPGYSELSRDGHIPYWDLPMKAIEIPLSPIMDGLFRTDSWMGDASYPRLFILLLCIICDISS